MKANEQTGNLNLLKENYCPPFISIEYDKLKIIGIVDSCVIMFGRLLGTSITDVYPEGQRCQVYMSKKLFNKSFKKWMEIKEICCNEKEFKAYIFVSSDNFKCQGTGFIYLYEGSHQQYPSVQIYELFDIRVDMPVISKDDLPY